MGVVNTVILVLCAASLGLYGSAWLLVTGWRLWHRLHPRRAGSGLGVSVIKPLCGADDDLERNLVSFFKLDHAPLQLVFGAADPADPALALVRRIARRHPRHDVAIVIGANHDAANPKVGLQERMLPVARHGIILLSDSNVRVAPDEMARVLPAFDDPRVGMAYQAVVGVGEESLPAAFENLHYAELAGLLAVSATLLTGQHVVNGKGQWVRREALADAGGVTAVRDNAADDAELGRLVGESGWKLALAPDPVRIVHRTWSWRGLWQRHLRHAGLRRRLVPAAYPLELLMNPLPWTLLLVATPWAAAVVPLIVAKIALEASAARILRGAWPSWRHAAALPLKDALYCAGWFATFAVPHVHWRGRVYRLAERARLVPLEPAAAAAARRVA